MAKGTGAARVRAWAIRFGVAAVSALATSAIVAEPAEANGVWRLGAYICNVDFNDDLFNANGAVLNGDADNTGFADCVLPIFADGSVPTGTDRTCDIDEIKVVVTDSDGGTGNSNGVAVTLMTHNGSFDVVDVCTTINTEESGAGFMGTITLTYDETDSGATEADIDPCTNDNNTEWLMMHLSFPDQSGATFSGVHGFRVSDFDNEASGCSST